MKKFISITSAFAFALAVAFPTVALANRPDIAAKKEAAVQKAEQSRLDREQRIAEIKEQVEQRKAEIKQQVCERRQQRIQAVLPRLATGATSVKKAIDNVYERVQGFYESGQLTVSNYDELVEKIELSKANSEEALAALETFEFTLDCENNNVGQQLDAYRTAVKEAKELLKTYRKDLVALISSLRSAAAEQEESTETEESETENEDEESEEAEEVENE